MVERKKWFEWLIGSLEQKRQYKQQQARVKQLPASYRQAQEAIQRYLLHRGGISNGEELLQMLEDLTELMERAAADGTSVAEVFGEDPVDFAEEFLANYTDSQWINKEKDRLKKSIDEAVRIQNQGNTS
ncbi:DUF1048 domain-containing protein [Nesterenkonia sp. HG001]|uniref:DUF1048 domain-containing protein n=1 Tax=Nesterenkonia sp. HG001 TaxID=2983207 RepID=UPI002AC6419F|nr:DUF1048 domain-containing protein [Nesterenkonia sp. HG001]MDZ5077565.1 DUF1048 domain-containing protein [Nesterenkonia sp. HG001]